MTERKNLPEGGYFVVPRWIAQIVIAMSLATFSGLFYIGWYMSSLDGRVAALEKDVSRSQSVAARVADDRDRLTIVEQQVISIRQGQEAQNRTLERISDRLEQFYRTSQPLAPRQ
jgi:hypothetical protein